MDPTGPAQFGSVGGKLGLDSSRPLEPLPVLVLHNDLQPVWPVSIKSVLSAKGYVLPGTGHKGQAATRGTEE